MANSTLMITADTKEITLQQKPLTIVHNITPGGRSLDLSSPQSVRSVRVSRDETGNVHLELQG